jgi:hypothetical protein
VPNPVLGDTELTVCYSGYQPFGPLRAPIRITQSQGGFPIWDITGIRVDTPDVHLVVPDSVATATAPPVWVNPRRLAPGVWHLGGGITHSVAVGVVVVGVARAWVGTSPGKGQAGWQWGRSSADRWRLETPARMRSMPWRNCTRSSWSRIWPPMARTKG